MQWVTSLCSPLHTITTPASSYWHGLPASLPPSHPSGRCCHTSLLPQDDARLTCLADQGATCGDPIPASLAPPLNTLAFMQLNATGLQNYTCREDKFYLLGARTDLYNAVSGEFAGKDGAGCLGGAWEVQLLPWLLHEFVPIASAGSFSHSCLRLLIFYPAP